LIFKQEEVASCLLLVVHFGLKATPAYTPTAYIHHNFQSDNRKVSRTIKKASLVGAFLMVIFK